MSDIVLTDHDLRIILREDTISMGDGIILLTKFDIRSTELTVFQKSTINRIKDSILSSIKNKKLSSSDEEIRRAKEFYEKKEEFIEDCYKYPVEMGVISEGVDDLDVFYCLSFLINKEGFIAWCRTLNPKPDFLELLDEDAPDEKPEEDKPNGHSLNWKTKFEMLQEMIRRAGAGEMLGILNSDKSGVDCEAAKLVEFANSQESPKGKIIEKSTIGTQFGEAHTTLCKLANIKKGR